ncbi:uncharacterized protein LOC109400984 [Aedes albopictus]|uniref:Secreted protein n=1 Tax=Aedes albopictus TaxID=7160 RepID=A0ABM1Z5Q5_AEDAL
MVLSTWGGTHTNARGNVVMPTTITSVTVSSPSRPSNDRLVSRSAGRKKSCQHQPRARYAKACNLVTQEPERHLWRNSHFDGHCFTLIPPTHIFRTGTTHSLTLLLLSALFPADPVMMVEPRIFQASANWVILAERAPPNQEIFVTETYLMRETIFEADLLPASIIILRWRRSTPRRHGRQQTIKFWKECDPRYAEPLRDCRPQDSPFIHPDGHNSVPRHQSRSSIPSLTAEEEEVGVSNAPLFRLVLCE